MGKTLSPVFIFLFITVSMAFSQTTIKSDPHNYGITFGLNGYQVKEKVLCNVKHSGRFFSGGFSFEQSSESSLQNLELYFTINKLKSRYDPDNKSIVINPFIHFSYKKKVRVINQKLSLYAGGITGGTWHLAFYENWDDSHLYWLTNYFIGVDGKAVYRISGKSDFFIGMNMPVLSLVSRPPALILYKMDNPDFSYALNKMHENIGLTSLHRHFMFDMNIGYTYEFSDKFKQRFFWRMCYIHNSMENSKVISIMTHTFGIKFLF